MVQPLFRRSPVPIIPASGTYVAVGDSITDPENFSPFPGGIYATSLATQLGLTRAGAGRPSFRAITAGGSGYTSAPTIAFVPTSGGSGAAATATIWNGAVVGYTFSSQGASYGAFANLTLTGGGFSVAAGGVAAANSINGGSVPGPLAPFVISGTNSYDTTRAAIGGTALQTGSPNGFDFVSNLSARCTAYAPTLVTIYIGTNDYYQSLNAAVSRAAFKAAFKTAYQTALTAILALSPRPVVILMGLHNIQLLPIAGLPSWAATIPAMLAPLNEAIIELAGENRGCLYCPLYDLPVAYMSGDGVHPLQTTGHTWIFNRLMDAITGKA